MESKKTMKESVKEFSKNISVALIIALLVRSALIAPYKIPSGSMIPTLLVGDHIMVSKLSYSIKLPIPFTNVNLYTYDKPKRGDVIVFKYPKDESVDFIKRLIAIPGDIIEVHDKNIYINGVKIAITLTNNVGSLDGFQVPDVYKESFFTITHDVQFMKLIARLRDFGPITVPAGSYFVMGDNRDNSADSREWGFVPEKNIVGRALFIWFSWDSERATIRFDRFFKGIK